MHTVIHAIVASIVALIGGAERDAPPAIAVDVIVVTGGTTAQRDTLEAALVEFEAAGLDLPGLLIQFAAEGDTGPCKGHAGLFRHGDGHTSPTVSVCSRLPITLYHELAHAHIDHAVADEARQRYLRHWGLDEWSDPDADWSDRGNELAANTIAHTLLLAGPTSVEKLARLVCGYEVLTGRTHAGLDHVDCGAATAGITG